MCSVAIVGGGFGGVGAAALLQRAGYTDVTLFERGERLGGVWHHNTYPGAACDIPSHLYEFSFAPNPPWSRRYAGQAEIQAYIEDVARRHGVRARTSTEVRSARWEDGRWVLATSAGPHVADVLITACGQLSIPNVPALPGLDAFEGEAFHTARWRHDVALAGRRVAVIGTGCSAVQVVPAIAADVAQLDVYQRSPAWTIPKLDFAYPRRVRDLFARFPALQRVDRAANWHFHEFFTHGMVRDTWRLRCCAARAVESSARRQRPRAPPARDAHGPRRVQAGDADRRLVSGPGAAQRRPGHGRSRDDHAGRHPHRATVASGLPTCSCSPPASRATRSSRRWRSRAATGGRSPQAWDPVAQAYLGVTVPASRTCSCSTAPTPTAAPARWSRRSSRRSRHVLAALRELERTGARTIEVRQAAADKFNASVREALAGTVWHSGCTNWYVDAHGHDPSNWPWSWTEYRRRTASWPRTPTRSADRRRAGRR